MHPLSLAPAKPARLQSASSTSAGNTRLQTRKPLAALALLAVSVLALSPVASMASERPAVTKTPTKIKLTASPNPVKAGQILTLTGTITPSKATGTVTAYGAVKASGPFTKIASEPVKNGIAKGSEPVPKSFKTKETVYIKAIYTPAKSSPYATSTSNVVTVVIN